MASNRIPIIVGDRVRAFLDAEHHRSDRTLSDIIRSILVDSGEFKAWDKLSREPAAQPKTITTVVVDTPPRLTAAEADDYLRRTSRYREPGIRETMAQLDRVSDATIPITTVVDDKPTEPPRRLYRASEIGDDGKPKV